MIARPQIAYQSVIALIKQMLLGCKYLFGMHARTCKVNVLERLDTLEHFMCANCRLLRSYRMTTLKPASGQEAWLRYVFPPDVAFFFNRNCIAHSDLISCYIMLHNVEPADGTWLP